jgi:iron complex outermembrane receptor protein
MGRTTIDMGLAAAIAFGALAAAVPGTAAAQDIAGSPASMGAGDLDKPNPGVSTARPGGAVVGELVVTARKKSEAIQNVPIAVTALTAEAMQDRQIRDLSDVALYTPSFQLQEAFGRQSDRPVIRGASNIFTTDAKVGVFIDGIPFFGDFSSLNLDNAARVEVINGPQSAVFGRGTLSGAINIVTRRPGDEAHGLFSVTGGTYNRYQANGLINGPITPWLGAEASVNIFSVDGQYKDAAEPGQRLGGETSFDASGALYFHPSPDFNILARYLYTRDDDEHPVIGLQDSSFNNCDLDTRTEYCGVVSSPQHYYIATAPLVHSGLFREAHRGFLTANWDIVGSGWNLTYQLGANSARTVTGTDQTFEGQNVLFGLCYFGPVTNTDCGASGFYQTTADRRVTTTNEIRLSSPDRYRVRARIGFYHAHDRDTPLPDDLKASEFGLDTLGNENIDDNYSVFGGIDVDILRNLTLSGELRYQRDKVTANTLSYVASQYFSATYLDSLAGPDPSQVVGTPLTQAATFTATLPRVTLTWRALPKLTLFAQYSEGDAPGGFNSPGAPSAVYKEETLKNYEVGLKTRALGFDYLSLALYHDDYGNQVLSNSYIAMDVIGDYKVNLGKTRINGIELQGNRTLFTPNLRLQFSYSYTDAKIVSGVDDQLAVDALGAACLNYSSFPPTPDLSIPACLAAAQSKGKTPPLVSKHLASVGLRYDHTIGGGGLHAFAGADVIYRSSFYDEVENLASTGDSTQLNLQIGVHDEHGLKFTIWGKNVANDTTPVGILRYDDFNNVLPNGLYARALAVSPPRRPEFGATLLKAF